MAYLVKPFQKSDLVPAVEIALSRFAELAVLEAEVATLTDRLETRKVVERAKGQLMAAYGDERAAGLQMDPAHRDGPPDDHARSGGSDHRGNRRR